ncbi:dynein axonemal assembly factor 5-like isoform X1 [Hypanus sabinus]|uniref:dynein axonemal assembly factor 5-like isoform X1 n=1 Tax=Hypanus sabinus TaxID=79690 RepID=UPI0028C3B1C2|nr:dynein axonemal assembly factor 5-like isoform X1 [Hypanus sabinus]
MAELAVDVEAEQAAEVCQALGRHLNCLSSESKSSRRRALECIRAEAAERQLPSGVRQRVLATLLRPLLSALSDPAERCRELSICTLAELLRAVPRPHEALPYLLPAIVQRLGLPELAEPAEELRLALVELLVFVVELCGARLASYLDDMVKILQRTIVDPFPEVKKKSCECAAKYAKWTPETFHMQSESLIKPLMQTISHQHSKVRVSVIRTTGAVIQYGNGKSVDDVLSHLAQRLFDDAPLVRQAVTEVVGSWLLDLRDRYSFFHKLIPLLLSSCSDEVPQIRELASDYWRKVGLQWQQENEEDLKDKLDWSAELSINYPVGAERPGLGCRELVFRNLFKILPAVSRDITDWVPATRVKASQLLIVLLFHAEDHITQHMELLLSTLYRSCADEEKAVVQNSLKAAELIGTFVEPEVSLKLILTALEKSACTAHLMVLGAVIRGSSAQALHPHLIKIGESLALPDTCQVSAKVEYLEQLLLCAQILITVCGKQCREINLPLLKVLVTVMSMTSDEELKNKAKKTIASLAAAEDLDSSLGLYRLHIKQLIEWVASAQHEWTKYSVQHLQFETIITQSGPVLGESLDIVFPVLKSCLQPSKDPEVRLKLFSVLSKLLLKANETLNSQGHFSSYLETLVRDILVPNLLWHAGRTAAAVRTTAVSCLWALLHSKMITLEQALGLYEGLMPKVIAALDEDSKMSRLLACRAISAILKVCGDQVDPEKLNKLYPELLKRLDDCLDEVRIAAAKALSVWFQCCGNDYDRSFFKSHIEFLYRALLVHLDDPESEIQKVFLDVLKVGSFLSPALLTQEIEAVKHKHRSSYYCEQLLQHVQQASGDAS